jgi:hypothetical protein
MAEESVSRVFFNRETNIVGSYTECWINERIKVRDLYLIVRNHYWKDSQGKLWGDFNHPMENVYRGFAAYRHAKNYITPDEIIKKCQSLYLTVDEFADMKGINRSRMHEIINNKRIQTPEEEKLLNK